MTVVTVASKTVNDIFKEVDKFGRFQFLQYALICLPLMFVSMAHVNYVFVAEEVDHRCLVPECDNANPSVTPPKWWPLGLDKNCFKPVLDMTAYEKNNRVCSNATFQETVEPCTQWLYEHDNSVFSTLDLGCASWKATLVGTVHNAGMIASTLFVGWVGDKIGRKPTVIMCSVGGCIGVLKIFVSNYPAYLTLEFLESLFVSGLYTVGVVLLIEVGGETKRVITGLIFSYAVYIGEIIYAIIAMLFKYWKYIVLTIYAPMILFLLYFIFLKESTRWQMIRGRMQEARHTLKKLIKINKIDETAAEIDAMSDEEIRSKFNIQLQTQSESFKDIIGSKEIMIRLGVASACFFTSSFLYYGLVVNSVLLPGNKYVIFILASLTAFPGDILAYFAFHKFGRRLSLQAGYLSTAVFLIAQTYTPLSLSWLKILFFLFGKIGVVLCFTGIYTYSLELFPTSVRGSLLGAGNTAARFGSMLAPMTPLLVSKLTALPSILFACTSVIAAFLLSFTPETKTLPLFDTVAQVDAYKKKITTHL